MVAESCEGNRFRWHSLGPCCLDNDDLAFCAAMIFSISTAPCSSLEMHHPGVNPCHIPRTQSAMSRFKKTNLHKSICEACLAQQQPKIAVLHLLMSGLFFAIQVASAVIAVGLLLVWLQLLFLSLQQSSASAANQLHMFWSPGPAGLLEVQGCPASNTHPA